MTRRHLSLILWIVGYLATIALTTVGINVGCEAVLRDLGTAEAGEQWTRWKAEADAIPGRKPVASAEPPLLVLCRDNYPALLTMGLTVTTLVFGFLALTIRGSLRTRPNAN